MSIGHLSFLMKHFHYQGNIPVKQQPGLVIQLVKDPGNHSVKHVQSCVRMVHGTLLHAEVVMDKTKPLIDVMMISIPIHVRFTYFYLYE